MSQKVDFYCTPKFARAKGYQEINIDVEKEYFLLFGDKHFKVTPSKKILKHYIKKAELIHKASQVITSDYAWSLVRSWDYNHKHQDIWKLYKST